MYNIYMDGTMYGFICSNYMMICKTKYIEDLMLIYIFLSITLREEGKFTINTTKRCLFRLSEMQPVECPFSLHGGKFFLSPYVFYAGAFSIVFETVLLLCRYSRSSSSSSQILAGDHLSIEGGIQEYLMRGGTKIWLR